MKSRIDWYTAAPGAAQALLKFQAYVNKCGLEHSLLELVKLRASQINGCAYCIDMHSKDARAAGETEQRLYLLDAWREAAHLYNERELAALAWTEAVTRITDGHAPDVLACADQSWSLGPLTLPHMLVRLVLAEQLYRATTLLSGHPYHRA